MAVKENELRSRSTVVASFRYSRGATDREGSTGTWGYTAGVKASREASQTHQTVNRGGSDHQREEGGGLRRTTQASLALPVCINIPLQYVMKAMG